MKKYFLIFFFLISISRIYSQIENSTEQISQDNSAKFFEDLLNFSSGKLNLTRVDAYIQIPYTTVEFVKSDTGFIGNYTVTISVFNESKDKLITEKSWTDKLYCKEFGETKLKENYNLDLKSFDLKPGKYFIRTSYYDNNSKAEYSTEIKYSVRDLSGKQAISDVMIMSNQIEEDGKNLIRPNVSGNVTDLKDGLPVFYEIYSDKTEPVIINYKILNNRDKIIFKAETSRNIDSGKTEIFYTLHDSSFSVGNYKLDVSIKNAGNKLITKIETPFFSQWIGLPNSVTDLNNAIDQLVYIASTSQINYIKEGKSKEEKLKRFIAVWKSINSSLYNDGDDIFDEYYGRVNYANEHFSQYYEGWKTDMGMVFILLGAPNNVDRHPFNIDSKPYEVWEYYNLDASIIFVDATGFGDYRLITPLTGYLYRFRR